MKVKRTAKEKMESKLVQRFAESFDSIFRKEFSHKERIIFSIYDKLKKMKKYADISFNRSEDSLQVDINPILLKEKPALIEETAKRMALKMHLFLMGLDWRETSDDYRNICAAYHIWNYGPYPETPQKWHVYSCSKCNRHLLVYSRKLPAKDKLVNSYTIWHKHNPNSETEEPHQGRYAYSGVLELTNPELQELLHNMVVIRDKTDYGKDVSPTYYYEDEW